MRRDDLAGRERRAVVHGDDADLVVGALDDLRAEAVALGDQRGHLGERRRLRTVERQVEHLVRREHDELREVDRVGALAQDHALRAVLAAALRRTPRRPGSRRLSTFDASVCVGGRSRPSRAKT